MNITPGIWDSLRKLLLEASACQAEFLESRKQSVCRDSRKGRAQSHQGAAVVLFTDGLTKWAEMTADGMRQDPERRGL